MIYAKKIVLGLNRFYRGHFQNTPNIKTFFGYAVVRTFKSIPEAARELGFSEAAVKKAKYSNRNIIGEYQLEWLEPKPEKPAFNRLERVKLKKNKELLYL